MTLPYHAAAARADSALSTVVVVCTCPDCGQPVTCTVDEMDVTVPECADVELCCGQWRIEEITERARDKAAGERHSYLVHLLDGAE
jgi:hypothetical protein